VHEHEVDILLLLVMFDQQLLELEHLHIEIIFNGEIIDDCLFEILQQQQHWLIPFDIDQEIIITIQHLE